MRAASVVVRHLGHVKLAEAMIEFPEERGINIL